jgi:hypothetical protein
MKEKWIITFDLAGGSLVVGISLGMHHLVNPTKCCTSSSLRWLFQSVISLPKSDERPTLSEHTLIEEQETRTRVNFT